ncbi:MAG TPA: hypothetical protein DIV79_01905 [Opitutae bacterium]|nr:hypothetical protein [Opitutaceae bacterium]HCR28757.1 hypothetical protein [Opitutae bacterium]|tara:strand:- start:191 stop:478 length:288 start_codon:yes stop_codon:yes gene_type:complete
MSRLKSLLAQLPKEGGTMPTSIDTRLTIKDLESYIKEQMDDPRHAGVEFDPILDIILHCQKRLENGDYMPRVVSEAMVSLDEYLLERSSLKTCVF